MANLHANLIASRTIRMVENGIKPIYVFDGKPPQLKSGVVSVTRTELQISLILLSSQNDSRSERKPKTKKRKLRRLVSVFSVYMTLLIHPQVMLRIWIDKPEDRSELRKSTRKKFRGY